MRTAYVLRCLLASFLVAVSVRAQSIVWNGAGNRFTTSTNWTPNAVPSATNDLQFGPDGGNSLIYVNTATVNSLEFLTTRTAAYVLSYDDAPATTLTINTHVTLRAGPDVLFTNAFIVALPSTPSADHIFNIEGTTTLQINSLLTGTGHLSKVGTGTLVLTGANTLNYDGTGAFNNGIAVDGGTLHLSGGSLSQPSNDIIVGSVAGANGVMLVSNGGDVAANYGVAGNATGTNATITVTGTGSTWTNSQGMAVGYLGTGFLNILAGGTVTTTGTGGDGSYLGLQSGTAGTGVVSGAGSAWNTPSDQLIIGGGGVGTLTIDSGGVVTSSSAHVGLSSGGIGNVLITGAGSAWSSAGNVNIGPAGTGTVTVAAGGTLSANNGAGAVSLASSGGTGILNIGAGGGSAAPGGIVNALFITTGSGSGTVQFGTSSNTFSDPYYLTRNGTPAGPAVTITGATQLVNTWGFNALTGANTYTGGTRIHHGTLFVRGAGSISHVAANLQIGQNIGDNGEIHVDAGGDVTVLESRLGLVDGSSGFATVDGVGSTLNNTNYLYVGLAGFGELNITAGGAVSSPNTSIGNNVGGDGQVLVSGAGSSLTNTSTLYVGSEGIGYLDVLQGALVSSANTSIGNNLGSDGLVIVSGAGSTLASSSTLYVGAAGLGYLDITQSGLVTNATASIGNNAGGEGGYVFLTSGGTWNTTGALIVGNAADGFIDAYNGSTITATSVTLGATAGNYGEVFLLDAGTSLSTSGNLTLGSAGDAYLDVTFGADVTTGGSATLAAAAGSYGSAFLGDAGTTWSVTNALVIGQGGMAYLEIADEALLTVGGGSGTVTLGSLVGGSGLLQFGFFNGEGGDSAGILNAATITTGAGTGQVYFGSVDATQSAPFYLTKDGTSGGTPVVITGPTSLWHEYGYSVLAGANTFTGGTLITGGTLVAAHNTALGSGTVTLDDLGQLRLAPGVVFSNPLAFGVGGGKLGGRGTFSSPLTLGNGAVIAPGDSPGTLNFSSGLTLSNGGALEIEIQAPTGTPGTDWDFLNITGTLDLSPLTSGNYTLFAISLMPNGSPGPVSGLTAPTSWTIATASAGIIGFESSDWVIDSLQFSGGGIFTLGQSGNSLVLTFVAVPEPSTYALLALGLGLIVVTVRRRRIP